MFKQLFQSRKPKEKFSLENLKYLYGQLVKEPVINNNNKARIVETLRAIAELMIWGDQHNPQFFDYFAEKNILSNFVKILSQRCDQKVKIQVIQTLSILIQNTESEISVFYLLSNNYINDLIVHRFDFSDEELLAYYISFLKTLSLKLNSRTILFFFNQAANDFPLYTEAIKFFNSPEQMVQIAVRTLTLNVYKVQDDAMRRFILDRSAVPYFSNLVWFARDRILDLNRDVIRSTYLNHGALEEQVESQIDLFYYLQDILNLGIEQLRIISSPPQYPVKTDFPLTSVLFPKSANRHTSGSTSSTRGDTNVASTTSAGNSTTPDTTTSTNQSSSTYTSTNTSTTNNTDTTTSTSTASETSTPASTATSTTPATVASTETSPATPTAVSTSASTSASTSTSASASTSTSTSSADSTSTSSDLAISTQSQPVIVPAGFLSPSFAESKGDVSPGESIPTVPVEPVLATSAPRHVTMSSTSDGDDIIPTSESTASDMYRALAQDTPQLTSTLAPTDEISSTSTSTSPSTSTSTTASTSTSAPSSISSPASLPNASPETKARLLASLPSASPNTQARILAAYPPIGGSAVPTITVDTNYTQAIANVDPMHVHSPRNGTSTSTIVTTSTEVHTPTGSGPSTPHSVHSPHSRSEQKDMPMDENLKARSKLPDLGPVSSPLQEIPNYSERQPTNIWREALFGMLDADDERDVFGAVAVIYCIVKSDHVDRQLMRDCEICPQSHTKRRRLLAELTSSSDPLFADSMGGEEDEDEAHVDVEADQSAHPYTSHGTYQHLHSSSSILPRRMEATLDPSLLRVSSAGSDHAPPQHGMDEMGKPMSKDSAPAPSPPEEDDPIYTPSHDDLDPSSHTSNIEYSMEDLLMNEDDNKSTLTPMLKAVMVQDAPHMSFGEQATSTSTSNLNHPRASMTADPLLQRSPSKYMTESPVLTSRRSSITSTNDDKTVKRTLFEDINADPISLSHAKDSIMTDVPLDYPHELVDKLIGLLQKQPPYRLVTIQLMIALLSELVYHKSPAPCLTEHHLNEIEKAYRASAMDLRSRFNGPLGNLILDMFEDEWSSLQQPIVPKRVISNSLHLLPIEENPISGLPMDFRRPSGDIERTRKAIQVFLTLRTLKHKMLKKKDNVFPLADESLLKAGDEIAMSDQDAIPCSTAIGRQKLHLFLVVDLTHLLLVTRHPSKPGYANVEMVAPLRHQEAFLNRNNASVLHVTIRGPTRPHPSCRKLKGGTETNNNKPLWNLTLLFHDRMQCAAAKRHLEHSRIRLRKNMLSKILKSFEPNVISGAVGSVSATPAAPVQLAATPTAPFSLDALAAASTISPGSFGTEMESVMAIDKPSQDPLPRRPSSVYAETVAAPPSSSSQNLPRAI